ncbi:MAG: hypothetical protein IPK19_16185 [Chloroflexi bacterium]|nr:hypothetical protein [Chloroflexota bacterium]
MTQQTVVLDLPEDLYERIRQQAQTANRPVEEVVTETLALLFGLAEHDVTVESLESRSDAELWAIVHRKMTWDLEARIRGLSDLERTLGSPLSAEEELERDSLVAEHDRYVLVRSTALLLLKQRGHDIDRYLGMTD